MSIPTRLAVLRCLDDAIQLANGFIATAPYGEVARLLGFVDGLKASRARFDAATDPLPPIEPTGEQ